MRYNVRMSAGDNIQYEQLRMFMSPNDLIGSGYKMNPSDIEGIDLTNARNTGYPPEHAMERRKANEASDSGLFRSIARRGVEQPLGLYTGEPVVRKVGLPNWPSRVIANGGHRYAVQRLLNPDRLMPVLHSRTPAEAVLSGESFEDWR